MAKKYQIGLVIQGDGKGGIKAINATGDALDKLNKKSKTTQKENTSLKSSLGGVATKLGVAGAAVGAVTAGLGALAGVIKTEAIREMRNLSNAVGVSVEDLSEWSYAAESVGLSSEKMGDIFKDVGDKLGDLVATGGGEAKDLFDNLGLSIDEIIKLSPDEQLLKIAEGLDQVGTKGEKIFYLESLADEASRLLPLLEDGADGLREMQRRAELLGISLDDIDAEQVKNASDDFKILGDALDGIATQLTVQLSGAWRSMDDSILDSLESVGGIEGAVESFVDLTVDGIAVVLDILHVFDMALKGIELAWATVAGVVAGFLDGMGQQIADVINAVLIPFTSRIADIGEVVATIASEFGDFLGETGDGLKNLGAGILETTKELSEFRVGGDEVNGVLTDMQNAADKTAQELEEMRNRSPGDEFIENFKAAQKETRQQAEEAVELREATEKVTDATENATGALGKQTDALKDTKKATEATKDEANEYAVAWERAVERIDEAFADGWLDLIQGNATDVFDSILDGFEKMLAEMLHLAITKPIMIEIQAAAGEFLGIPGFSGGGVPGMGGMPTGGTGGGFGGLSNIGSLFTGNSVGSGFADFGGTLGSEFGLYTNDFGGTLFNDAAGYSNMAYAGAGVLGGLFGGTAGNNGDIGGSIGATIGMAAGGPIGAAIGAVLGGAVGSLFGGSWETYDRGLIADYDASEGLEVRDYEKEKKDRGLWRGNKYRTEETVNEDLTENLGAYFGGLIGDVRGLAGILGIEQANIKETLFNDDGLASDVLGSLFGREYAPLTNRLQDVTIQKDLDEYLNSLSFTREFSFDDKTPEQVTEELTEYLIDQSNKVIEDVFGATLTSLQDQGEELVDTLYRVTQQLAVVGEGFDAINLSLQDLAATAGVSELEYADEVADAAGGIERLTALIQGYQSTVFTQEELLTRTLSNMADQLKTALDGLGLENADEFREKFEAASAAGLSASDLVDWLEAGNLIGQFNNVAAELAAFTGDELEALTGRFLDEAKIILRDEKDAQEAEEDAVVVELSVMKDTLDTQLDVSNSHLTDVNQGLKDVEKAVITSGDKFQESVNTQLKRVDGAIQELSRATAATSQQVQRVTLQVDTAVRDLSRSIATRDKFPIYTGGPVTPAIL